jgi:hypothetical protein
MILCQVIFGCLTQSSNDIELLKQKYSAQVLNYFYEVALHSEIDTNRLLNIQKWENDIYLFVQGDTLKGDHALVHNVINELNSLKLPFSIYETSHADKANVILTFVSRKKNEHTRVTGSGIYYSTMGTIHRAMIKISYDPSRVTSMIGRTDTIYEEITQGLGLPGDSYAYPESMFYQGFNYTQQLTELDKQLLQLLYEPAIVANYSLAQFEKDFDEILYNINGKQKFINFLNVLNPSEESLQNIFKHGLSKDPRNGKEKISKYHYPTHIVVKGDYTQEFINVLNKTISEINTISENLKLILINEDSLLHMGGVHFNFVKNPQMNQDSAFWEAKHLVGSIIPRNSKNEVTFKYRDHDKLMENIRKAIPNLIYKSVCLTNANETNFYDYNNTEFQLKPLYRETLRVYYDNSLPAGFTKEELEGVIREYVK